MSDSLNGSDLLISNRAKLLENIGFFKGMTQPQLLELAGLMKQTKYEKNTIIINQGDLSRSLFVIVYGRLKAYATDEDGNQTIFSFFNNGNYFGELSLLDDAPRSATVSTLEECTLLNIDHTVFKEFIDSHPDASWSLFRSLTSSIRIMDETICSLTSNDIHGRLIAAIYKLAEKNNDEQLITPKLTHQDFAEMIGSSREMVSRIFKDLKDDGYISVDKKQVAILKRLPTSR